MGTLAVPPYRRGGLQHTVWMALNRHGWAGATDEELAVQTGLNKGDIARCRQGFVRDGHAEQIESRAIDGREKRFKATECPPLYEGRRPSQVGTVAS